MAMKAAEIEQMIRESFPDAQIEIKDLRGDDNHYAAHIESCAFAGRTRVQQHQMVFAALKGKVGDTLHALSLTTAAPKE
ncbi:MAG: BolA family transcriptional regulator [Alphaproteobacteria bacterium]